MANGYLYSVELEPIGFTVGKEVSEEKYLKAATEFSVLYNTFADSANCIQDNLNDAWDVYEKAVSAKNEFLKLSACALMGIRRDATYMDWIEKNYKEICDMINEIADNEGFLIKSCLLRVDDLVQFGAQFKENENWKIGF